MDVGLILDGQQYADDDIQCVMKLNAGSSAAADIKQENMSASTILCLIAAAAEESTKVRKAFVGCSSTK